MGLTPVILLPLALAFLCLHPAIDAASKKFSGRMSTFGGPDDKGVTKSEGLSLFSRVSQRPEIFLSRQPPGTSGLARRLNPSAYYVAMRWNETLPGITGTRRNTHLRRTRVTVSANGKSALAWPADWGPHRRTGRLVDMSPGLAKYLGLRTDDTVTVEIPLP